MEYADPAHNFREEMEYLFDLNQTLVSDHFPARIVFQKSKKTCTLTVKTSKNNDYPDDEILTDMKKTLKRIDNYIKEIAKDPKNKPKEDGKSNSKVPEYSSDSQHVTIVFSDTMLKPSTTKKRKRNVSLVHPRKTIKHVVEENGKHENDEEGEEDDEDDEDDEE